MGDPNSNATVVTSNNSIVDGPYTLSSPVGEDLPQVVKDFSRLVRDARERTLDPAAGRPLTQQQLAKALGVSPSLVSAWETGGSAAPSREMINAMARIMPVSVEEILSSLGYEVRLMPLSEEEREILQHFRRASPGERRLLLGAARSVGAT